MDWDRDSPVLERNLRRVLAEASAHASKRGSPSPDLLLRWHAEMMRDLDVPDAAFVGRYRGGADLERIGVRVGECLGSSPSQVSRDVDQFFEALEAGLAVLDAAIPQAALPRRGEELDAVLEFTALMHARWIAIHPFANGNGRTARLIANWIALRYGLVAFVRLRPRPEGDAYARAARAALCEHDYEPSVPAFREMFDRYLGEGDA